jgi:hypothetical protein
MQAQHKELQENSTHILKLAGERSEPAGVRIIFWEILKIPFPCPQSMRKIK